MTTKRTKGKCSSIDISTNLIVYSVDLALPVAPYYRTDPQVVKDIETMRTNASSRWAKDDYSRALSRFHTTDDSPSKINTVAQPKVEILRANSPTLKRLLAARIQLEKYSNAIARTITTGRPSARSTRETPYLKIHEKQTSAASQAVEAPLLPPPTPPPPPPPPPVKPIKPSSRLGDRPLDKITYEKTWSLNGNMKQKCSLEIWLPKPSVDNEGNSSRTVTPEIISNEKKSLPVPMIKSRRSSVVKITATTTITNIETKPLDDINLKKSDSVVIPHVYHYADYIMDLPDERPRSSKSVTTVKSDSAASLKSIRRQQIHSNTRRLSSSTHHSEEILRFATIEVPTSAKAFSINTKSTNSKVSNPTMINELMQKYSLIKKNHQELTQAKLQIEKPNTDAKANSTKDQSPRSRPPPIPESTSLVPSDHPAVSVRKLLVDPSPIRSTTEQNNTNPKLLERRSTPHQPPQPDIYPHLRIFSLANQRQNRQSSAKVPAALLPNVPGKKMDETSRILQRSKTLDVVLDIPSPVKVKPRIPTQLDISLQHTINRSNAHMPLRATRRSPPQQNASSPLHRAATTMPTNTVLIHFNHGNNERNYLVPE
jgi:hypothetical protein